MLEFGKRQVRLLFLSLKVSHASRGFRMSTEKSDCLRRKMMELRQSVRPTNVGTERECDLSTYDGGVPMEEGAGTALRGSAARNELLLH